MTTSTSPARTRDVIPLREATKAWFAISLQTVGGPAGQISVMQHKLVDEKRWIGQKRFLHALNYCMLLPGPEAQQLAVYTGWLLNGFRGGLIAGVLFVLPGMLALLALSAVYVTAGSTDVVSGLFAGLAPAVIAIVVQAVHRVGKRALHHPVLVALAVASFLALTVFAVPFPVVIVAAGSLGWALGRGLEGLQPTGGHPGGHDGPARPTDQRRRAALRPALHPPCGTDPERGASGVVHPSPARGVGPVGFCAGAAAGKPETLMLPP